MLKKAGEWEKYGVKRIAFPNRGPFKPTYCHSCLVDMAIRCCWCGEVIWVGDPITLSRSTDPSYEYSDYSVPYSEGYGDIEKNLTYVGCLRINCASSGIEFSGYWSAPGEVYRVPLVETIMRADSPVILNDISDPRQVVIDLGDRMN
jgi:hypothetical protein